MTPPMSMFSEGSSSASTRSSLAFGGNGTTTTSTATTAASSYMRSSEGGSSDFDAHTQRTSRGNIPSQYTADTSFGSVESGSLVHGEGEADDEDDGEVGVGITSDDAVHLAHSTSMSSLSSASRVPKAYVAPDSARWSGSSTGLGMSGGRGLSASMHDLRNQHALSAEWNTVPDEREEYALGNGTDAETDEAYQDAEESVGGFARGMTEDTTDDNDDEDDEDDEEDDVDRTAAVFMAEEGLGLIIHGEGLPVDRLVIRQGEDSFFLSCSPFFLL